MTGRSHAAAKKAGTRFESEIVAYLNQHVDDRIERRAKSGSRDRGDVTGLQHMGQRIVVEAKNHRRMDLSDWVRQAEIERLNDDAGIALVVHKRTGVGDVGEQYVTTTLRDLVSLLAGERPS